MASTSESIYHAAAAADWAGRTETEYEPAAYADEGFVHCSSADQLPRVLEARFRGRQDLHVLTIDPSAVTHRLVWEDLYDGGEDFPHIYGPVELAAVTAVQPLPCDEDGGFSWSASG